MTYKLMSSRSKILLLLFIIFILVGACSKTIVRENILSSIETGIGLTLAENKQTQMYELKAGYIRSQFYSIPTGKVVEVGQPPTFMTMSSCHQMIMRHSDGSQEKLSKAFQAISTCRRIMSLSRVDQLSNAADVTPEVVSGIRTHTGLQDIVLGMQVSENFAVGAIAVNSPAAIAMYITQTEDAAVASAASLAASSISKVPLVSKPEAQTLIFKISNIYTANSDKQKKIEEIVKANGYGSWNNFLDTGNHNPVNLIKVFSEVEKL